MFNATALHASHTGSVCTDLQTVYSQASPCFLITTLQVADDTVVHIFFLLSQEVGRHGIEGVAAQLVVALYGLQQVKLDAAVNGDLLVVIGAIGFAAELSIPHAQFAAVAQKVSKFKYAVKMISHCSAPML